MQVIIVLDLNDHKLTGPRSANTGIYAQAVESVIIKNGALQSWNIAISTSNVNWLCLDNLFINDTFNYAIGIGATSSSITTTNVNLRNIKVQDAVAKYRKFN